MRIPPSLARTWRHEPEWLRALPRLAAECGAEWNLDLETPIDTPYSLVIPAGDAVLKLNAPSHFEAEQEGEALARWEGRGAVRLLARDDARGALLIERCVPGERLWDVADTGAADELRVLLELIPRLERRLDDARPFATQEAAAIQGRPSPTGSMRSASSVSTVSGLAAGAWLTRSRGAGTSRTAGASTSMPPAPSSAHREPGREETRRSVHVWKRL
jgi:Aminoglycoside/hydroxyurea antibiotic resistance kinase